MTLKCGPVTIVPLAKCLAEQCFLSDLEISYGTMYQVKCFTSIKEVEGPCICPYEHSTYVHDAETWKLGTISDYERSIKRVFQAKRESSSWNSFGVISLLLFPLTVHSTFFRS